MQSKEYIDKRGLLTI